MSEFRIDGKNAVETLDWLRSIAKLVIEEHLDVRGTAPDAGGGATDTRGRLRARWKVVEPCVDRLSPCQRQVVELRFREGMRYADIADCLGIPIGTVRSRLARARLVVDGLARENGADASAGSPANASPAEPAAGGSGEAAAAGRVGLVDAEVGRSEHEPGM